MRKRDYGRASFRRLFMAVVFANEELTRTVRERKREKDKFKP